MVVSIHRILHSPFTCSLQKRNLSNFRKCTTFYIALGKHIHIFKAIFCGHLWLFVIVLIKPQLISPGRPTHTNTNTLLTTCMLRSNGSIRRLYTSAKHYGCTALRYTPHILYPTQKHKVLYKKLENYYFFKYSCSTIHIRILYSTITLKERAFFNGLL